LRHDEAKTLDVTAKLILGMAAFVLIGWLGARDKRIGGVLLTFPLLNGIAMLTGADPLGMAGAIYLVMMWNCLLLLLVVHRYDWLPPLPAALNAEAIIVLRVVAWTLLWAVGAALLARFRDTLSVAPVLFVVQLALVALAMARCWRPPQPAAPVAFRAMWLNRRGAVRIGCFVAAFGLLSVVAYVAKDSRWVGSASALPLPGMFALATLSVTQDERDIASLGDTVLLGPLLFIPFNALLARAIIHLRAEQAGTLAEIATVVLFWAITAGLVFGAVPQIARWRDRL
jgi:uncharacterized membrane protein (GlpM family)